MCSNHFQSQSTELYTFLKVECFPRHFKTRELAASGVMDVLAASQRTFGRCKQKLIRLNAISALSITLPVFASTAAALPRTALLKALAKIAADVAIGGHWSFPLADNLVQGDLPDFSGILEHSQMLMQNGGRNVKQMGNLRPG